jgi:hypothetical protein
VALPITQLAGDPINRASASLQLQVVPNRGFVQRNFCRITPRRGSKLSPVLLISKDRKETKGVEDFQPWGLSPRSPIQP